MKRRHGRQREPSTLTSLFSTLLLAGCAGAQSALDPASGEAARLAWLGWAMFAGAAVVLLLVVAVLFWGLRRGRSERRDRPLNETQSRRLVIAGGVLLPLAVLAPLLFASIRIGNQVASAPAAAMQIEVIGRQWWWEVRYLDEDGRAIATTANEIHLPVGRPVRLRLIGGDVIHSFWVPKLHGKTDLIPGFPNTARLRADEPGIFRGQCAEYCGVQHAHMGFFVIAQPAGDFRRWLARIARPARAPADEAAVRGRQVFLEAGCGECHTIRGTHLVSWLMDPQALDPRTAMPNLGLTEAQARDIAAYLYTLRD